MYILVLVWIHFVADFALQTDKMATGKSTSNRWLAIHVLIYALPFLFFGWKFALVTGLFHWATDYVTSRGTTFLWKRGKRHWFFTLIGFDQAIHMTTLLLTFQVLGLRSF
jgi:hypothetical protein